MQNTTIQDQSQGINVQIYTHKINLHTQNK
jgi:hypothetical protein